MEKSPVKSSEFYSVSYGKTPNGGVKTVAYFFAADGSPCREEDARSVQILEYDQNDVCVFSLKSQS